MRRLSAAAAAVFVAASSQMALAAPLTPQIEDWTGFYAGLNAGENFAGSTVNTTATNSFYCPPASCGHALDAANASIAGATGEFPVTTNGLAGGAQLGYNWQMGNRLVAGLEADLQGLVGASGSFSQSSTHDISGFAWHSVATELTVTKGVDYLGTVRGRLGFLVTPSLLLFGTGGFAYGHVNADTSISQSLVGSGLGNLDTSIGSNSSVSEMLGGWTVGGGAEWKFAPNWTVKAEDLYYDLGSVSSSGQIADAIISPSPPYPNYFVNDVQSTTRFNGNIFRIGLNLHF